MRIFVTQRARLHSGLLQSIHARHSPARKDHSELGIADFTTAILWYDRMLVLSGAHFGPDVIANRTRSYREVRLNALAAIIAAAEILFEPNVHDDEEIPASHFSQSQLGSPGPTVSPGDRYCRPRVAADDRLQRELDCE